MLALLTVGFLAACGGGATPTTVPTSTPKPVVETPTLAPTNTPVTVADTPSPTPTNIPTPTVIPAPPVWKYVNSGWVIPYDANQVNVFEEKLRVFVITSEEELDAFEEDARIRITRGTTTSLGRIDFPNSILLVAYYLWRPLQGDPLSVVGFSVEAGQADVMLELEDSPQGRERPYLLAPMTMVAIERSHFSKSVPIDFVFHLNGVPVATVSAAIK